MSKSKAALKEPVNQVYQDIEHEEILSENGVESVKAIPIEEQKQLEIAKFGKAEAGIAILKKKYNKLSIKGLLDKAGIKKVEDGWRDVRNTRIGFEKKHKEITGDYVVVKRAIDDYKNKLIESITPLEKYLGDQLDEIERLKKEEKDKEEREAQEKLQGRVASLIENGMKFNGSLYAIGETISLDVVTIKTFSDEEFANLMGKVKAENSKIVAAEEERQRKEKEEKENLDQQKIDQENERRRLLKDQDDFNRQKQKLEDDMKRIKKEKTKLRAAKLEGLGMVFLFNQNLWQFSIAGNDINPKMTKVDVENETDEDFEKSFESLSVVIADLKQREAARLQQEQEFNNRMNARIKDLIELEYRISDGGMEIKSEHSDRKTFFSNHLIVNAEDWKEVLIVAKQGLKELNDEKQEVKKIIERLGERAELLKKEFDMKKDGLNFVRVSIYPHLLKLHIPESIVVSANDECWTKELDILSDHYKQVLADEKKESDRIEKEAEEKRLSMLSELEKLNEYYQKLSAITAPNLETDELDRWVSEVEGNIMELGKFLFEKSK